MSTQKQQLAQEEREFISDTVHQIADVIAPKSKKPKFSISLYAFCITVEFTFQSK